MGCGRMGVAMFDVGSEVGDGVGDGVVSVFVVLELSDVDGVVVEVVVRAHAVSSLSVAAQCN